MTHVSGHEVAKVVRFAKADYIEATPQPLSERVGLRVRYALSIANAVLRGDEPRYSHLEEVNISARSARRIGASFLAATAIMTGVGVTEIITSSTTEQHPSQADETKKLVECVKPIYDQYLTGERMTTEGLSGPPRTEVVEQAARVCYDRANYQDLTADQAVVIADEAIFGHSN